MGLRTIDWEWTLLDNTKALVGGVWGGFVRLALRPLDASRDMVLSMMVKRKPRTMSE